MDQNGETHTDPNKSPRKASHWKATTSIHVGKPRKILRNSTFASKCLNKPSWPAPRQIHIRANEPGCRKCWQPHVKRTPLLYNTQKRLMHWYSEKRGTKTWCLPRTFINGSEALPWSVLAWLEQDWPPMARIYAVYKAYNLDKGKRGK